MEVIDGVRYRSEDVPKKKKAAAKKATKKTAKVTHKAERPQPSATGGDDAT